MNCLLGHKYFLGLGNVNLLAKSNSHECKLAILQELQSFMIRKKCVKVSYSLLLESGLLLVK